LEKAVHGRISCMCKAMETPTARVQDLWMASDLLQVESQVLKPSS
jgi:hypothetical protein